MRQRNKNGTVQRENKERTREREGESPVMVRFSTPVQTGPGAHTASYKMGTGSFLGVKRPKRGVNHPPDLAPRLKKE
jgi:hypothetical protein